MFEIVKYSRTYKRGTTEGRNNVILKTYEKQYKTERSAKMILSKLGWKAENKIYDLPDGFKNSVGWEVRKAQ